MFTLLVVLLRMVIGYEGDENHDVSEAGRYCHQAGGEPRLNRTVGECSSLLDDKESASFLSCPALV